MVKITWNPPESREKIEHSGLIEKFVEHYIVKEIFPEPNPFLLKADIRSGKYLGGSSLEQSCFEQIELCASGNLSLSFNPRCELSRYEIDLFGKSESQLVTKKRSRIGKIYHGRVFASEKESELESFYFSPSSSGILVFRAPYAADIVQLIYNPNFSHLNCDSAKKQVFVAETGHILLVKDK